MRAKIKGARERIAWCHNCGNTSWDGLNFSEVEDAPGGWLECAACGEMGPFAYVQQAAIEQGAHYGLARLKKITEEWPLKT